MNTTRYPVRRSLSVAPWRDIGDLSTRMSRMFEDVMDSVEQQSPTWRPAVNVEETADELVLTADLPGLTADDVTIELENNVLSISGERTWTMDEGSSERRYHVVERRFGGFNRTFTLPLTVNPEQITAHFENGVLIVNLPKMPEAKGRRIEISTS